MGSETVWQLFAIVVNLEIIQQASSWKLRLLNYLRLLRSSGATNQHDLAMMPVCQEEGVPDTLLCGKIHHPL